MTATRLKTLSLLGLTALMSVPACKENLIRKQVFRITTGVPGLGIKKYSSSFLPVPEASIAIYSTEENFLLAEEPVFKGYSNQEGVLEIPDLPYDSLWFRATKDTLNNLRFNDNYQSTPFPTVNTETQVTRLFNIRLSTTPTKLMILINNLDPINAPYHIQLYLTEKDYNSDIIPSSNLAELNLAYGAWDEFGSETAKEILAGNFSGELDESFSIHFDNLEPRKYWIRLTDKGGAVVQLQQVEIPQLPDDPNIINWIEINAL